MCIVCVRVCSLEGGADYLMTRDYPIRDTCNSAAVMAVQRRFVAAVAAARRRVSRQRGSGVISTRKAETTVLYKDGESEVLC